MGHYQSKKEAYEAGKKAAADEFKDTIPVPRELVEAFDTIDGRAAFRRDKLDDAAYAIANAAVEALDATKKEGS
jgi:hypothetical protein